MPRGGYGPRPEPTTAELAAGWIAHFASADRDIIWLELEREYQLWLDKDTLLIGKIDARGRIGGDEFFADWKTIKPYAQMEQVKMQYELDPQMLTYAVLTEPISPSNRYCVRWAVKNVPPTYDHCWYRYGKDETSYWKEELLTIARRIREDRDGEGPGSKFEDGPWLRNYQNCFKYGVKYPCPFYGTCSRYQFRGARDMGVVPRVSHLATERELVRENPNLVVLDATRTKTWLDCNERYRKQYEENLTGADNDALIKGKEFHEVLDRYYNRLVPGRTS